MKHYLLFYEVADDYVARRTKFRSEHLARGWEASRRGELLLGGAYADPADGAVLLFKGESRTVAEDFARGDPYITSGAVKRWYVREWTTVVGDQAATPVRPDTAAGTQSATSQASASATAHSAAAESNGVARLWKGRATAVKAGDYARHVAEKVFPQIRSIPGHRGAYLLRRSVGNSIEFLVLTLWASMDAVRRFAGPEPEKAVVEPAARAVLSDFEEIVTHYELVAHEDEGTQQPTG
jgi:uncharacterized protein